MWSSSPVKRRVATRRINSLETIVYKPSIKNAVDVGATARGEIETARDRGRYGDRTGACTFEVTDTSPPETPIRSLESKFFFTHTESRSECNHADSSIRVLMPGETMPF